MLFSASNQAFHDRLVIPDVYCNDAKLTERTLNSYVFSVKNSRFDSQNSVFLITPELEKDEIEISDSKIKYDYSKCKELPSGLHLVPPNLQLVSFIPALSDYHLSWPSILIHGTFASLNLIDTNAFVDLKRTAQSLVIQNACVCLSPQSSAFVVKVGKNSHLVFGVAEADELWSEFQRNAACVSWLDEAAKKLGFGLLVLKNKADLHICAQVEGKIWKLSKYITGLNARRGTLDIQLVTNFDLSREERREFGEKLTHDVVKMLRAGGSRRTKLMFMLRINNSSSFTRLIELD